MRIAIPGKDLSLNGLTELDRVNRETWTIHRQRPSHGKLARIKTASRLISGAEHQRAVGEPALRRRSWSRIGDAALISCPAEALTEIGLSVKKQSPLAKTYMAAYSNGYMHYGAPAKDYPAGGYEVTECFLAPEWEKIYLDTAQKILASLSRQDNT